MPEEMALESAAVALALARATRREVEAARRKLHDAALGYACAVADQMFEASVGPECAEHEIPINACKECRR